MKAKELLTKLRALNDAFEGQEKKEMFAKVLSKAENVEYESAQELYDLVKLMDDVEGRPKKDLEFYEKLKEKPDSGFTSQLLETVYRRQLWHDPLYRVSVLEDKITLFEEVLKEVLALIGAKELERKLSSRKVEEVYYVEEEEREEGKEEERDEGGEEEEEGKKEREDKKEEEKVKEEEEEDEEEEEEEEEEDEEEEEKKKGNIEAMTPGTLMPEDPFAHVTFKEEENAGMKLFSYEKAEKPLTEEKSPSFYFSVGYAFTQESEENTWPWEKEKEERKEESLSFLEEEKREEGSLPFSFLALEEEKKEEEKREESEKNTWSWGKEEQKEESLSFLAEEKEKSDEEEKREEESLSFLASSEEEKKEEASSAGGSEGERGSKVPVPVGLALLTAANVAGFLLVRILGD